MHIPQNIPHLNFFKRHLILFNTFQLFIICIFVILIFKKEQKYKCLGRRQTKIIHDEVMLSQDLMEFNISMRNILQ